MLSGANAITGLGASNVDGDLLLTNTSGVLAVPAGNLVFSNGALVINQTGDLVVNGTVSGSTTSLTASGGVQVNGNSAIARNGDLDIQSSVFTLDGLLQAAGAIRVQASTSAALTGTASGTLLSITSPSILFGGMSVSNTLELLSSGDVSQKGGTSLAAGLLTGTVGGSIALSNPTNLLPVVSDLSAGTTLALGTGGDQVLTGTLTAPSISLATGGGLTESGAGRIAGGTLSLQTGNSAALSGANAITGLGASNVGGDLLLKNSSTQLSLPVGQVFSTTGTYDIQQAGTLVIDGTITGAAGSLSATRQLHVNGHSAIARNGDLNIQSNVFTLDGLLQAAGAIRIQASTSAALTGTASATLLSITSPSITFGGLSAANTPVSLFLGPSGIATGTLDASALSVFGGASANLFGSIAGITGGAAAATGQRGTSGGTLLTEPLPNPTLYLFNNCPLGVAICTPVVVPPPPPPPQGGGEVVTRPPATEPAPVQGFLYTSANPPIQAAVLEPVPALIQQLRPPVPNLNLRLYRDRSEEGQLAPPNIRGEDF